MEYKSVGSGTRSYVKYKECLEGQVLAEGTYLGQIDGKYGHQHLVRKADGNEVVLNKSGQLDYLLENHIQKGDQIKVVFKGKIVLDKGIYAGKESNQFEVLKASSTTSASASEASVENMAPAMKKESSPAATKLKTSAQTLLETSVDEDEEEDAESILARYRS